MSDTTSRGGIRAPQMVADALLRTLTGTTAQLCLTNTNASQSQSEMGLLATSFVNISICPVVMRKLRPALQATDDTQWEMLLSATTVEQQVSTLDLASAQSLFELTLGVNVAGQNYLIDSYTANEAFGQIYLYRLLLHEAKRQGI